METIKWKCRRCKKVTNQSILKITDNLPPNVEVLQCNKCEVIGVEIIGSDR